MNSDYTKENGKEKVWWAENASGYIYFASPMSDLKPGFILKSTTNPKDMDRLFKKMNDQEREHNEKFIEKLYANGREQYEAKKAELRRRIGSAATSNAERTIIREALKLMDAREAKAQENTVYGVSAMQEAPEPLPARNELVMIEDYKVDHAYDDHPILKYRNRAM